MGKKAGRRRGGEGKEAARTHTKGGTSQQHVVVAAAGAAAHPRPSPHPVHPSSRTAPTRANRQMDTRPITPNPTSTTPIPTTHTHPPRAPTTLLTPPTPAAKQKNVRQAPDIRVDLAKRRAVCIRRVVDAHQKRPRRAHHNDALGALALLLAAALDERLRTRNNAGIEEGAGTKQGSKAGTNQDQTAQQYSNGWPSHRSPPTSNRSTVRALERVLQRGVAATPR